MSKRLSPSSSSSASASAAASAASASAAAAAGGEMGRDGGRSAKRTEEHSTAGEAARAGEEREGEESRSPVVVPASRRVEINARGIIECGRRDQYGEKMSEVFPEWSEKPEELSRVFIHSLTGEDVDEFMRLVGFGNLREIQILETSMNEETFVEVLRRSPLLESVAIFQIVTEKEPFKPWSFEFLGGASEEAVSESVESIEFTKGAEGLGHLLKRLPSLRRFKMRHVIHPKVLPFPAEVYSRLESFCCLEYPNSLEDAMGLFAGVDEKKFHTLQLSLDHNFKGWTGVIPEKILGVRTLELTRTSIDTNGFARIIGSFTALESLSLSCADLHFADMHPEVRSERLRSLSLQRAGLAAGDFEQIAARFPNLRSLNIAGNQPTLKKDDLAPIASLSCLNQLCIAGFERTHTLAITDILRRMPQLRVILHSPFDPAAPFVASWKAEHPRKTFIPTHSKTLLSPFWYEHLASGPSPAAAAAAAAASGPPPPVALCSGGVRVSLDDETISLSSLLRSTLDLGEISELPLPEIDATTLERIKTICALLLECKIYKMPKPIVSVPLDRILPTDLWEILNPTHMDTLLQLLFASNYLQIDAIFEIVSARIFEIIKNSDTDEIRRLLCIPTTK